MCQPAQPWQRTLDWIAAWHCGHCAVREDTPSPLSPAQLIQVSSTLVLLGALGREGPNNPLKHLGLSLGRFVQAERCARCLKMPPRASGVLWAGAAAAGYAQ